MSMIIMIIFIMIIIPHLVVKTAALPWWFWPVAGNLWIEMVMMMMKMVMMLVMVVMMTRMVMKVMMVVMMVNGEDNDGNDGEDGVVTSSP